MCDDDDEAISDVVRFAALPDGRGGKVDTFPTTVPPLSPRLTDVAPFLPKLAGGDAVAKKKRPTTTQPHATISSSWT